MGEWYSKFHGEFNNSLYVNHIKDKTKTNTRYRNSE